MVTASILAMAKFRPVPEPTEEPDAPKPGNASTGAMGGYQPTPPPAVDAPEASPGKSTGAMGGYQPTPPSASDTPDAPAKKFLSLDPKTNLVDADPVTLPFGEWLPDLMDFRNPGAVEALNVIPTPQGYRPFRDITPIDGLLLPDVCKGGIVVSDILGDVQVYVATSTDLYLRVGGAFVSKYHNTGTISETYLWQFIPFGDNLVAVHPQSDTQVATISTSSAFSTLGGTPPRAACGARVGDFLVLGNLIDVDGTTQFQRIRWNGFGVIDDPWVTDPTTQADFQDMPSEGGSVIGIIGRETGTIFQQRSISRMTEVGLPTVFDIVTVEQERGALCVGGIVDGGAGQGYTGTCIYFLASDGFYMWNGYSSTSISNDKVENYFFGRLDISKAGLISASIDLANDCIWWAFPAKGPLPQGVPNAIQTESGVALDTETLEGLVTEQVVTTAPLMEFLVYNYSNQRWSHVATNVDFIFPSTVTSLAASIDSFFGNLDTDYSISFDDPTYDAGGGVCVVGFDENHNFGPFTGVILAATIDTAEDTAPGGMRVFVNKARPLIDSPQADLSVQLLKRDQLLGDVVDFGPPVSQEITGECPVMDDARYMRFRTNVPRGTLWAHAVGIDIWRKPSGEV